MECENDNKEKTRYFKKFDCNDIKTKKEAEIMIHDIQYQAQKIALTKSQTDIINHNYQTYSFNSDVLLGKVDHKDMPDEFKTIENIQKLQKEFEDKIEVLIDVSNKIRKKWNISSSFEAWNDKV